MDVNDNVSELQLLNLIGNSDDEDRDPDYIPEEDEINLPLDSFFQDDLSINNTVVSQPSAQAEENLLLENEDNVNLATSTVSQPTRKRRNNPKSWKMNINHDLCEHGLEYKDVKGVVRPAKKVKFRKNCETTSCKFSCGKKITVEERKEIHKGFWNLSNDAKLLFYSKNTDRIAVKRKQTAREVSRRKYTYLYFFHIAGEKIKVCKTFFLSALDISQQRINYFYEKKINNLTGLPTKLLQGCHPKKVIPCTSKDYVRAHINSIPRVESHYCRKDSRKEYFDVHLNLNRLYDLYKEFCAEKQIDAVKFHCYRSIFNYEFNINFLKPKKDRCDTCEEYRQIQKTTTLTEDQKLKFENHTSNKEIARHERNIDRENSDPSIAVISFDLENVFALPRSNISCFFYSRKLNTYNLTAHCNLRKQAYCCIWNEGMNGRKGSDMASALIKILLQVVSDFPEVNKIILWSDSCVAQNRNSIMSFALLKFLEEHPRIQEITQKFCEPGHSEIQEVDGIHSQIERKLQNVEIFSPLGLVRHLLTVNRKKPFMVLQMNVKDFMQYKLASAKLSNLKKVPYFSVKQIKYFSDSINKVFYKHNHNDNNFIEVPLLLPSYRGKQKMNHDVSYGFRLPTVQPIRESTECLLSLDKVYDLKKLFKFMPPVDAQYLSCLFKDLKNPKVLAAKTNINKKRSRSEDIKESKGSAKTDMEKPRNLFKKKKN